MSGRIHVVKVGGEVAQEAASVDGLFGSLKALGVSPVIVHGGGALASSIAAQYGRPAELVAGRRITSAFDLQTILWSVCGEINTTLVAAGLRHGFQAVGLSGADAHMIRATRRPPHNIDGRMIDFGHVGDIDLVQPDLVLALCSRGYLPIVATLGIDAAGSLLNINADTVAGRLATALSANALSLVTPSGAVRRDPEDASSALLQCTRATFEAGVADGWIHGGMRAKLEEALRCRESGVPDVWVSDVTGIAERSGTRIG